MRITDLPLITEVKDDYIKLRQNGLDRDDAVAELQHSYHDEITLGAEDDGLAFWVGVADGQYALNELSEEAARNGLAALDKIEKTDWEVTPGDIRRRRERYAAAPMPERKSVKKPKKFRCTWKIGDTFAYQLNGPDAEAHGLSGRYMLLRKVDELEFSDGRLLPVVTVTMWDALPLPRNAVEFQRLPALKLANGRFGFPRNQYEYRAEIIIKNARQLSLLSLEYLGNFANVCMPANEIIIRESGSTMMLLPEMLSRDFCLLWKYHNRHSQQ